MASSEEGKVGGGGEQKVDPWTAQAAEGSKKIDYDKLIGKDLMARDRHVICSLFYSSVW